MCHRSLRDVNTCGSVCSNYGSRDKVKKLNLQNDQDLQQMGKKVTRAVIET